MKRETDKLLDELAEETASAEFRTTAMREMLGEARRRQRNRRARWTLAAFAVAAAAAAWLAQVDPAPTVSSIPPRLSRRPNLVVIQTQPLNQTPVVETKQGSVNIVGSHPGAYALVETRVAEAFFARLNDEDLLRLLQGRPIALTRQGPHEAELIFLDPGDREQFFER